MVTAEGMKVFKEGRDGLVKSISVVQAHIGLLTEEGKKEVVPALEKAIERARQLGGDVKVTPPEEPADDEEEEIKLTKEEVEKLIALFKKQLDGISAVEKLLTIEIRLDAEVDKCLADLKKATDKEEAKKLLDKIKDFAKIEKRLIDVDEYKQLRLLINEFDQIKQSYNILKRFSDAFASPGGAHRSDRLAEIGIGLHNIVAAMDKHIKDDESAKLRVIAKTLEDFMGDAGIEANLLKHIDIMKRAIEAHPGSDLTAFINDLVKPFETLLNTVKEHMAAFVTTIRSLETDIKDIIVKLAEIIKLLEEAKKLVK